MKKIFNYSKSCSVLLLIITAMFLLVGCPSTPIETPPEPKKLDTPTNLKVVKNNDEYVVSFDEVENAGRYALVIMCDDVLLKEVDIKNNAKLNLTDAGHYTIKIKAKPKTSKFLQSDYSSEVSFIKTTPIINFHLEYVDENKDSFKIVSYKDSLPSKVIVPDVCDNLPITEIAANAFNKSTIAEITLLDGITVIGNDAFKDCAYLKKVTLPNTVISLGDRIFSDCYALKEINIPTGELHSIPTEAFKNCASLEKINIPANINTLKPSAFSGCDGNVKYVSGERVLEFIKENGVEMTMEELAAYDSVQALNAMLTEKNITSIKTFENITGSSSALRTYDLVLSNGLTEISLEDENTLTEVGNGTFDNTTWYKNQEDGIVYFGKILYIYKGQHVGAIDNIREDIIGITVEAFFYQRNLTAITIPSGVKKIPHGCFRGCGELKEITLKEGLECIDIMAFDGCYNLKSVTIPSTVTVIEEQAFINCSRLENVTISSNSKLTTIGAAAFRGNSSLKEIYIPNTVIFMGDTVFSGCSKLTIKVAANSIPEGWDKSWNPDNRPVELGK